MVDSDGKHISLLPPNHIKLNFKEFKVTKQELSVQIFVTDRQTDVHKGQKQYVSPRKHNYVP